MSRRKQPFHLERSSPFPVGQHPKRGVDWPSDDPYDPESYGQYRFANFFRGTLVLRKALTH